MKLFLYGEELEFDETVEKLVDIKKQFMFLYEDEIKRPMESILGIKGVDIIEFFKVIAAVHGKALVMGVEKAVEILYKSGLEYASEEEFYSKYEDVIDHFEEDIDDLVERCDQLENQYHMQQERHQLEKMGRSYWTGGGFGLKGAIKGAVTAKALNTGMDLFRGIKDTEKENRLSDEYKRKRDGILGSKKTYDLICNAIDEEYQRIAECVINELEENEIIARPEFDTIKAKALLKNTLKFGNPDAAEIEKVVVKCLRMDPFCKDIYDFMWEVDGENSDFRRFAKAFGMVTGEMLEKRMQTLLAMDESDVEALLKKIEACRKWELENSELLVNIVEDLLKKLVEYCMKDPSLAEEILKRLEIFGEHKKYYKTIGKLEAIKIFSDFEESETTDNEEIRKTIERYIAVRKIYGTEIIRYILHTLWYWDDSPADPVTEEQLISLLKERWDEIVSTKEEARAIAGELVQKIELPSTPSDTGFADFFDEKSYKYFLFEIEKLMMGASMIWEAAPKQTPVAEALADTISKTARYALEHNRYKIFYLGKNGESSSKIKELPAKYVQLLNQILAYINEAGESPFAEAKKKRAEYKQMLEQLDGFAAECQAIDHSSDADFDKATELLKRSDTWTVENDTVYECRMSLIQYWNGVMVPRLDKMWDEIANKTPRAVDDFMKFQETLDECPYLKKSEKQRYLKQMETFVEEYDQENESEFLGEIQRFNLNDFSGANYNRAVELIKRADALGNLKGNPAVHKIVQFARTYEKKNHVQNKVTLSKTAKASKLPMITLLLGIGALLTGCLCVGGLLGIAGIICGIAARKKTSEKQKMTVIGMILAGLGILLSIAILILGILSASEPSVNTATETVAVSESSSPAETEEESQSIAAIESSMEGRDMPVWSLEYLLYYLQNHSIDLYDFSSEEQKINSKAAKIEPQSCYLKVSEGFWNDAVTFKKISEETDLVFIGEMKNDLPDGYGQIYKYLNVGSEYEPVIVKQLVYDGMFKKGKYSGFGKSFFTFKDENELWDFSKFIKNSTDPQDCVDKYFNELEYIGYFADGQYDGKGLWVLYPDKHYTYQFTKRASMNADEDPNYYRLVLFSAEFEDGNVSGRANVYAGDFLVYEGSMKDSVMDGKGTLYYENSDHVKYEGEFADDLFEGKGTLYDFDGNVVCSGVWENNMCGLVNGDDYTSPVRLEQEFTEPEHTEPEFEQPVESADADYILPESSSKYLTSEDLQFMTKGELRLARNEIYARHGRLFQTDDLNQYFSSKAWYHGHLSAEAFDDSVLNEYEKANLELIKSMEETAPERAMPEYITGGSEQLGVEDIINALYVSDSGTVEMEIGEYSGTGETYANFRVNDAFVWSGVVSRYQTLQNGGLALMLDGKNDVTGEEDYLEIEWKSFSEKEFPVVTYDYDAIGISGSYSFKEMLHGN